jgi:hypothetical protein
MKSQIPISVFSGKILILKLKKIILLSPTPVGTCVKWRICLYCLIYIGRQNIVPFSSEQSDSHAAFCLYKWRLCRNRWPRVISFWTHGLLVHLLAVPTLTQSVWEAALLRHLALNLYRPYISVLNIGSFRPVTVAAQSKTRSVFAR